MLPKSRRLNSDEVKKVLTRGFSLHAQNISARCMPNNMNWSRFSAVVSKKIAQKAVLRNRLRRTIYTAISQLKSEIPESVDVVIFVHKEKMADTRQTLLELFKKIRNH